MAGTFNLKLGTFKLGHGGTGSVLVPTFPGGGAGRPFKEPFHKGATTVTASGS